MRYQFSNLAVNHAAPLPIEENCIRLKVTYPNGRTAALDGWTAQVATLDDVAELILVPLADNPALGREPLAWSLELWGNANPWFSADDWLTFYINGATASYQEWNPEGVDQEHIYIAVSEGVVVGAISLVDFDDIDEFRHLKPWVAAFVVDPDLRGAGIGSLMLSELEKRAKELGIPELYLWTEDRKDFYLKRGYSLLTHRVYPELSIDVLNKVLSIN